MNFSSKLLEEAVNEFNRLPGIGKRTALRLVLHILRKDKSEATKLSQSIERLIKQVTYCKKCHAVADNEVCEICSNPLRDKSTICVVEEIVDVMAIENTSQYKGVYHILGGVISPMNGIGPNDLQIESLLEKIKSENIQEVILALNTNLEGDTTNYYLFKKLSSYNIVVSAIARGIAIGDELEYVDDVTLGRSIINRTSYESTLAK